MLLMAVLVSCGQAPQTETPATDGTSETAAPEQSTDPAATTEPKEKDWPENPDELTFFKVYEAPKGDPRQIVYDYMMAMAKVEWTPAEDFTIGWEGTPSFDPNMSLKFYKDKIYRGVTYGNTHCTFELFSLFLNENNVFKYDNYSYEKIVGNNCSTTMTLAYQQIIDLPISVLKPISSRVGLLQLAGNLKVPEGMGDDWYTDEVFATNGQDAVFEAYTTLDKGDILYKSIRGTGHTRMVVGKPEITRTAAGKINPARSYVYCVESTNAWEDSNQTSLWFIDKKYSFAELYDTAFMPVTLCIFHEENPVYDDAYLAYNGTITEEHVSFGTMPGTVSSNFPINYVMVTITDADGNVAYRKLDSGMSNVNNYDLRKLYIDTKNLTPGNYTLTVRAGIARGGADIYKLDFSIK